MTQAGAITAESTHTGRSRGSPNGVTPPISMPVTSIVSSAGAKDSLRTPRRLRTTRLTSRRVVARSTHTANFPGGFFDATRIAFADRSSGMP